ncbi:MAG: prolyl aminopeptidase [Deltaproteobacteria bacterium RIFCSPLOWO2_02_FULL_44_10]|nr:MAG: prolyl aminopeptidase [Deltaproteobacteria bacterium RIFCSPLOWO2_02_FULL_44_10]
MKQSKKLNPYKKGYLKVTDGHHLYYELCGNPDGIPCVFLHGGPGLGFSDRTKKIFYSKNYRMIFFEQRGAGRSKPHASLKANTTWHLVEDVNRLLDFLNIDKAFLIGASWGSTLALVYAINNPHRVRGILIWGIYLASKKTDHYYLQGGVKRFYPEVWKRFSEQVPIRQRKAIADYYLQQMNSKNAKVRYHYCFEWLLYEVAMAQLTPTDKKIENQMKRFSKNQIVSFGRTIAHYMSHASFIPNNYILKNAHKLSRIPTTIFNGRYDVICPPEDAYALHSRIGTSKLQFLHGGHSLMSEKNSKRIIKTELRRMTASL